MTKSKSKRRRSKLSRRNTKAFRVSTEEPQIIEGSVFVDFLVWAERTVWSRTFRGNVKVSWAIWGVTFVVLFGWTVYAIWSHALGGSTSFMGVLIPASFTVSCAVLMLWDIERVRSILRGFIHAVDDYLRITSIIYTYFKWRSRSAPYIEVDTYQLLGVATLAVLIIVVAVPIVWWAVKWVEILGSAYTERFVKTETPISSTRVKLSLVSMRIRKVVARPDMLAKLRSDIKLDTPIVRWGVSFFIISLLLIPAVIYSDFTPEGTSANLNALYAAIVGSIVMICIGKKYRYIPALKKELFPNNRPVKPS